MQKQINRIDIYINIASKSQLTGKDLDAGKDWRRRRKEEKGITEDEMVG